METRGNETDLNQLVEEFKYLINIPEMARASRHFLNQIKSSLAGEYNHYNILREQFRKKQYGEMYVLGNEKRESHQIYRFELVKNFGRDWKLSTIDPELPRSVDIESILPQAIIKYMVFLNVEIGKIYSDTQSNELNGKVDEFNFQFARCADDHIIGTINKFCRADDLVKNSVEEGNLPQENKFDPWNDIYYKYIDWDYRKHTDEENFNLMFREMAEDQHTRELMFTAYFTMVASNQRKKNIRLSE